jgi:hypothetical protein
VFIYSSSYGHGQAIMTGKNMDNTLFYGGWTRVWGAILFKWLDWDFSIVVISFCFVVYVAF